jgi:CHAT domain-containing protein
LPPLLCALVAIAGLAIASPAPQSLDDCEALVMQSPDDNDAYACFTNIARSRQQWDDAARRLDAHLAVRPDNPAAQLQLAWIERDRGGERAEALFRDAADRFARREDASGEVHALVGLAYHLRQKGQTEAAAAESSRASVVAEGAGDPILIAWVRNQQGNEAYDRGDLETAARLFREAEANAFPDGPADLRGFILNGLGNTAAQTGEDRQAMTYYSRWAEILKATGNTFQEAYVRYNSAFIAFRHLDDWDLSPEEVRGLVLEALDVAIRAGNRDVESGARMQLGRDIGLPLVERIEHLERALEIQRAIGQARTSIFSLRQLARYRLQADPEHPEVALALVNEAVDLARSGGSTIDLARALSSLAEVRRATGPYDAGIEASLEALDAIENVRDLQRDDLVRARYLSQWDFAYYRFSGFLLDPETSSRSDEELDLAFTIMERLRARALLDSLDAAGATTAVVVAGPRQTERDALLDQIAAVQKQLLNPKASSADRSSWLEELTTLEDQERELRSAIAASSPEFAALRRPEIPSLEAVRQALDADEAMLAFQISTRAVTPATPTPNGGSWLLVLSGGGVDVVPLAERGALEDAVDLYLGLLERRDGSEKRAAARLYDLLLREAVALLPAEVTRIVVIPDGILHRLPFSTLRESDEAPPIASTHEITLAPSATIWMRASGPVEAETSSLVLALADPALTGVEATDDTERQATLEVGLRLGRLPHARDEAEAMVTSLGGRGTLRTGSEASERYLKTVPLEDFRIVHLAAHAVVDDEHPERSAVLLAPGAEEEDGLLQIREVVDLDLDGTIVILSACRSASGALVAGEGVVGLARAFIQAGARTVIGGLWPLRDDEAARFIKDFSRHLAGGARVGAALTAARRDGIRAGLPPAAWAGLVLLGDGDVVPAPGGVAGTSLQGGHIALISALLLMAIVLITYLRRRIRTAID